jgi:hypothetical protein
MKNNLLLAVGGMALLLAGCATSHNGMVLDSVGPDPASNVNPAVPDGSLLVYSAYEVNADFSSRDTHRPEYSAYRILSADGQLQQVVNNNTDTMLQRPKQVALPAGNYRVVAEANGYGTVTVPITIAAGEITMVHLQGGVAWPDHPAFDQSNAVRLPDGEVVGWKSPVAMR